MYDIEITVRRAFALAINLHNAAIRPDANDIEFDFIGGHTYELRALVGGYTFIGRYDSTHDNQDLMVEVTLTEVVAPDSKITYPNFTHDPFLSDLGDNYADLYGG